MANRSMQDGAENVLFAGMHACALSHDKRILSSRMLLRKSFSVVHKGSLKIVLELIEFWKKYQSYKSWKFSFVVSFHV